MDKKDHDMVDRRPASKKPPTMKGPRKITAMDDRNVPVRRAPRTLVITLDSKIEEHMEIHARRLHRSLALGKDKEIAFDIITNQIHDIGKWEELYDLENQILLRKHIIAWKAALTMKRRRLKGTSTDIPLTATSLRSHPISKCERLSRRCKLCCCAKHRQTMDADCTKPDSIERFLELSEAIEVGPTITSAALKASVRRQKIFDISAPGYFAAVPN